MLSDGEQRLSRFGGNRVRQIAKERAEWVDQHTSTRRFHAALALYVVRGAAAVAGLISFLVVVWMLVTGGNVDHALRTLLGNIVILLTADHFADRVNNPDIGHLVRDSKLTAIRESDIYD